MSAVPVTAAPSAAPKASQPYTTDGGDTVEVAGRRGDGTGRVRRGEGIDKDSSEPESIKRSRYAGEERVMLCTVTLAVQCKIKEKDCYRKLDPSINLQ